MLFLASIPIGMVLTDHVLPSPFAGTDTIVRCYEGNRAGVRTIAFLQLGSSLPLAVYAATATAYLRKRRIRPIGGVRAGRPGLTTGFWTIRVARRRGSSTNPSARRRRDLCQPNG